MTQGSGAMAATLGFEIGGRAWDGRWRAGPVWCTGFPATGWAARRAEAGIPPPWDRLKPGHRTEPQAAARENETALIPDLRKTRKLNAGRRAGPDRSARGATK